MLSETGKKVRFFASLMVLVFGWIMPIRGAAVRQAEPNPGKPNLTPVNTVLIANEIDSRFSRDYSVLLKQLQLAWILLDQPVVPESARDKNLVLLGHPDAPISGEVIRELLTAEEVAMLQAEKGHAVVRQVANPWVEDRVIIICSGATPLLRRDAAEQTVREMIASSPPASAWIRTRYDALRDEALHEQVAELRYAWEDTELPLEDLEIDLEAKSPKRITAKQAAEDVERLFYLLSHGYSGYAFFNQEGAFEQAKARMLEALPVQSAWTPEAFSSLVQEHLRFIDDGHLSIGDHRFTRHRDFWYDTQLDIELGNEGFQFEKDRTTYMLAGVDGADPGGYLFPSLNQNGEAVYRLGTLSSEEPAPLKLTVETGERERQIEVRLRGTDFNHYGDDVFQEDVIGGIPVVRVNSFGDYYAEDLQGFLETANKYRGDPVVIVDLRGNGGGNERWPIQWIQELTGKRAEAVFVTSELESKTSLVGRANAFAYWLDQDPNPYYETEFNMYHSGAESIESGERPARWTTPRYPQMPLIPNETTVIVVTNNLVASAGEGFVLRISQAENVVVVGENTMGALTFGNISTHQLPHSKIAVWMPINFGLFLDQEVRENMGLFPDLWVPAADAVDYAVAALRSGTITTAQPLPQTILEQEFIPETSWWKSFQLDLRSWLVLAFFGLGGGVWAVLLRKKWRILWGFGSIWVVFSIIWISRGNKMEIGLGYLLVGIISLVAAAVSQLRSKLSQ